MARKWTTKERVRWADFMYGLAMFPPAKRTPSAVIAALAEGPRGERMLYGPQDHSKAALHAASLAALAILRTEPFQSSGRLLARADAIVSFVCGDVAAFPRIAATKGDADADTLPQLSLSAPDDWKAFQASADSVAHAAVIAARAARKAVQLIERNSENEAAAA